MWHGGVTVRALASQSRSREFDSRSYHFHVMSLGKLFANMCHCASVTKQYNLVLVKGG